MNVDSITSNCRRSCERKLVTWDKTLLVWHWSNQSLWISRWRIPNSDVLALPPSLPPSPSVCLCLKQKLNVTKRRFDRSPEQQAAACSHDLTHHEGAALWESEFPPAPGRSLSWPLIGASAGTQVGVITVTERLPQERQRRQDLRENQDEPPGSHFAELPDEISPLSRRGTGGDEREHTRNSPRRLPPGRLRDGQHFPENPNATSSCDAVTSKYCAYVARADRDALLAVCAVN